MSPQFPTIVLRAQSDERLARLAACGNERAFEAIVDRYRQPLLRYATRMIGDSRADDVVQAAFVSAWTKLHDGEDVRELKAWLYRIVHNGSLNAMKRASSRDVPLLAENPMSSGDDSHAEVERREAVRSALGEIAALPEQQRHAFLAVAVEGRRHRDVGIELGVSEGAVRMLIHRARSSVRAAAAAFSPWPLISWFKGSAGVAGTGVTTSGSAGAGLLTGGALKAGALVASAGLVVTAGPQAVRAIEQHKSSAPAVVVTAAAPAPQGVPMSAEATLRSPRLRASIPSDGGAPVITPAQPGASSTEAATPAPEPAPAAADETPPQVTEQSDAVKLPAHLGHPEFIEVAAIDEDMILVEEDAPDYAAGERDVPTEGVDDKTAEQVQLADEPPAEALVPASSEPAVVAPAPSAPEAGTDAATVPSADAPAGTSADAPGPATP